MAISNADKFDQRILELVNQERSKQNLKSLTLSQELDLAADRYSERMIAGDFFSHTDPTNGSNPGQRISQAGYNGTTWGENIAAGYTTAEAVFQGWMNSSGHRANILNPNFTHMGLGYAYQANDGGRVAYKHYWTQTFGAGDPNPGQYVAQSNSSPTPSTSSTTEVKGTSGNDQLTGNGSAQTIYGYAGNDVIRGQGGDDKIYGNQGSDRLFGDDGNDRLVGGVGKDTLTGGNGKDVLVGVSLSSQAGKGEIDQLAGGTSADTFVLGDSSNVYYNDGSNNTLGSTDYALIQDFSRAEGDVIRLKGVASNYALGGSPQDLPGGTAIYLKTSGQDELIAVVQNTSNLSLNSSSFNYV